MSRADCQKRLIVDTVQWRHNTDLHDGCQIETNPAAVLYQLSIHAWGGLSGARNDVDTALAACQDSTLPLLLFLPPLLLEASRRPPPVANLRPTFADVVTSERN